MSRVADYAIVESGGISVSGVVFRAFDVPANMHPGSSGIVSFVVIDVDDVEGGSLSIKINNKSVYSATYTADSPLDRGVQNIFGGNVLKTGSNQMEIAMNPGGGALKISDLVVWFQVDSNVIGGAGTDGSLMLRKDDNKDRIRLDAKTAALRMGGGGTNGDIMLFPSTIGIADVPYPAELATIHLGAKEATLRMGKADLPGEQGQNAGKVLLRGGSAPGSTRIQLDASNAGLRMGGSGADGDIALFSANVNSDSAVSDVAIRLDAGPGVASSGGRMLLRGGSPQGTRILLDAGKANINVGGNGQGGDVSLYPATAGEFGRPTPTIRLNGDTGEIMATLFTPNADCAEDFEVADVGAAEPGTVMVIGNDSRLNVSTQAYDKRVAGVIAGAGETRPGIILGRHRASDSPAVPIALLGRVLCKVDAAQGRIAVGDLLTSSSVAGYAMKASDPVRAFGAVLGKALAARDSGRGLIPVLVALQ